ncbi:MAG: hypothetical protein ACYDAE_20540 [Steroidobacteraceae bacterium]
MAWHILRKDLRLLWPLAALVAAIHVLAAALAVWLGRFLEPREILSLARGLPVLSFLGIVVLTVALVQQDPLPGDRQDWLVRPIRRRSMIAGKLLFILLIVIGPLLLADLAQALADGFPLAVAFGAALSRSVCVLCFLALPALALGAATRDLTQALALAFGIAVVCIAAQFLLVVVLGAHASFAGLGASWMVAASWAAVAVVATAAVVSLQYLWRKTLPSRVVIGAAVVLAELSLFLPWRLVLAVEGRLSSDLNASAPVTLAFDPQAGPFQPEPGAAVPAARIAKPSFLFSGVPGVRPAELLLPLRVRGLASGDVLFLDGADIRIAEDAGPPLYGGGATGTGATLYEGRANLSIDGVASIADTQMAIRAAHGSGGRPHAYEPIFLPRSALAKLRDRPVTLVLRYTLTLLRAVPSVSIPADGGDARVPGIGWCATRIDGDGDAVELGCIRTAYPLSCVSFRLQETPGPLHNPAIAHCSPDYAPLPIDNWYTALDNFGLELPFLDRSGLAHYPIDGSALGRSRIVAVRYVPVAHFSRQIQIAGIRLGAWQAQ